MPYRIIGARVCALIALNLRRITLFSSMFEASMRNCYQRNEETKEMLES